MVGLVAYLWLVSGPFCGYSICHIWPGGSRVLVFGFE